MKFAIRFLFGHFLFGLMVLLSLGGCSGGSGGAGNTNFTLPNQGVGTAVNAVALAQDGSGDIYLGGWFTSYNSTASNYIVRLNSDATIESSFSVGSGFDNDVYTIAPALDGSGDIYVGGSFSTYKGTSSNFIIRLNSDGSIDSGFSVGTGFDSFVSSIVPATDGSGDIYVGGLFTSYNGTGSNHIIRLNSNGTVDASFATGTGFNNTVFAMALAADGSGDIYVGGAFTVYQGSGSARIIRLNSNGSIDAIFAVGTGFNATVYSISPAVDGTGDVYVGGAFANYNATSSSRMVRLNSNGSLDVNFAVGTGFNGTVNSVAVAADGSGDVYAAGLFASYNGSASNEIIRLNSDGSVDSGFAVGTGINGEVHAVVPTGDGSGNLYLAGWMGNYNGTPSSGLVRIADDGSVSQAFAENTAFDSDVNAIATATDGSSDIYVGGWFNSYNGKDRNHIARLNSDGSVDTAFDVGTGFSSNVHAVVPTVDGSGDIYVGGSFASYDGSASNGIIRLNSDGTVDTAFAVGTGFDTTVTAIVPANDGSGDIYVGGYFTTYKGTASNRIIRLNSDGSIDSGFTLGTGFNSTVNCIALAADGSGDIYVGGWFTSYNGSTSNYIIRLNSNGTVDTAFNVGSGFNSVVTAITPAADGSGDVYVGGWFGSYNGATSNRIVRINNDGSIDAAFASGSGFDSSVYAVSLADDGSGDIYVGGQFSNYNGSAINRIIRLTSDGAMDGGFAIDTSIIGGVLATAVKTDGSGDVYVGGTFTSYKNTTVMSIVLLGPDGTIN